MDPEFIEVCTHSYKVSFMDFLLGRNPINVKTCNKCSRFITLKSGWKFIYIGIYIFPIASVGLYDFVPLSTFAIILISLVGFVLFTQWIIVNKGKYKTFK